MIEDGNEKNGKAEPEPVEINGDQHVYLKKVVQERTAELVKANETLKAEIKERKKAEKALRENEELFHAVFNLAEVGIGLIAPDGRWMRINRKYCEIVGYSEEELKSLTISEITHPDDIETSLEHFRKMLEGEIGSYSLNKRYIRKDASIVWIKLSASMIYDSDGNPRFAVGVIEDITSRKKAEDTLRLSEERYRALYRDNPTMIFTLDSGFSILSANPNCSEQLGYSISELEGRSSLDVFHKDDRSAVAEQLRNCLRNPEQVYKWQFRKVRKDGKLLWVEEIAQAVYDLSGALNILIVCQDISDRKRAEEEIDILNRKLEARAAELETANRELEAFNYTVAHDLRKPLTVINILCQTIEELCADDLNEVCMGYVKESYNCTLRMNRLIEALLNFSRLAHVRLRRETVDLSAMGRVAVAEMRLSEPARAVDFRIEEEMTVNGDPQLLRVILDNLFGNAWKYTAEREDAVIEFGAMKIDGKTTYFVRDNGCGFDMEYAGRLFTPFQRLPDVEESRGLGIGLATVERIIHRHGGKVWAEGVPEGGATFYFTIPEEEIK